MKPSNEHVQEWRMKFMAMDTDSSNFLIVELSKYIAHKAYAAGRESMREEAVNVCEALADNYLHLSTTTDEYGVAVAYLYKQAAAMHCHNEIRDLPISEE